MKGQGKKEKKEVNPEYLKFNVSEDKATGPLVLQAKNLKRGPNEPSGEAQFVKVGELSGRMGDRYIPEEAPTTKKIKITKKMEKSSILNIEEYYVPKSEESKEEYEKLLDFIQPYLGDYPDVIKNAAEEILIILKDDNLNAPSKLKELDSILSGITEDQLATLLNISRNIQDFVPEKKSNATQGIALEFEDAEKSDDDEEGMVKEDETSDIEDTNVLSSVTSQKSGVAFKMMSQEWLSRQFQELSNEPLDLGKILWKLLDALHVEEDSECENLLIELIGMDSYELVKFLIENRYKIYYALKLEASQDKIAIQDEMIKNHPEIAAEMTDVKKTSENKQILDLDSLAFEQGSHLMSNKNLKLPQETVRTSFKDYEEISVPPLAPPEWLENEHLIKISDLPKWAQNGFKGFKELNRMQSRLYQATLFGSENVLLSAPTGTGKTNVAMLSILHEIGLHLNESGEFTDKDFKIVYIAPMKALVQEVVGGFSSRLTDYGITVQELTGDRQMTKSQIASTQIIVTTPEKWDIVSRKADKSLMDALKLIIIDEIHLLHDDRGAVLESIVARTIRHCEVSTEMIRIVGLSATLPNYKDVALFLRVPSENLFHFDTCYRPVPLSQQYIGITEKKALKRLQLMNEITYKKVMEKAGKKQMLVFVHSRKETTKSAQDIRDRAIHQDVISLFLKGHQTSRDILLDTAKDAKDAELKELLPFGIGIHHAGLVRSDRQLVEDLFADGHLQLLVSTATLAWGVNLPAHTVIIKGTQVYNPEKSAWGELSILDICQMIGRAGRIKYDTEGEGIIITTHEEVQFYLTLMNEQLPIESQFIKKLADQLNAEIVSGTISSFDEAVHWLSYTYLYVRMIRNPTLYGISHEDIADDPSLLSRRSDLIHTAATLLDKHSIIKYEKRTGAFAPTDLGQVASHFYITHKSIASYNQLLKPVMNDIELFRLFASSSEFAYMMVRREEKLELSKLVQRVPIPIKESVEEASCKVNCLLQSYISRLKMEGYALVSDMTYITQSAGRIVRAIFTIAQKRGWAQVADRTLDLAKMIEKRMWKSQSPLRQFPDVPEEMIRKVERKDLSWERMYDLSISDLSDMIKNPKMGKQLFAYIRQFPHLDLTAHVQPITKSMIRIDLSISPNFDFSQLSGNAESFWIWVLDVDCVTILHSEYFVLKQRFATEEHSVSFTVQMSEPVPPQYFVKVVSDRWLSSETILPISFRHLILPEKFNRPTELLDLSPLSFSALKNDDFVAYNQEFKQMNPIQTQTFQSLYHSNANVFVGAPKGSGKTICGEFAILRQLSQSGHAKGDIVVVVNKPCIPSLLKLWKEKFSNLMVSEMIGEAPTDLSILSASHITITHAENWDILTRRWKVRKVIQNIKLMIVDDLHLIGGQLGPTLEVIISRIRMMSNQLDVPIRLIGLSSPIANSKDMTEWMGCKSQDVYNFHPSARPAQLETVIEGYTQDNMVGRTLAMIKTTLKAIKQAEDRPVIIFTPKTKISKLVALELANVLESKLEMAKYKDYITDSNLLTTLSFGIGMIYQGMTDEELLIVNKLFKDGIIQILITTFDFAWKIDAVAHTVIMMGTQTYEGKEHRYTETKMSDLLEMIGKACRPSQDLLNRAWIFTHASKVEFYKKFLLDPFPVESHLDLCLADHLNSEIVTKTITNKQEAVDYLTWTFLYRRIRSNPNYYNLFGNTNRHVSDFLSELVENTLNELSSSKCVLVEDDMISPLNLGMISAHYYIKYTTIELFGASLTSNTKLAGLLEILCASSEFDQIVMRNGEDKICRALAHHSVLTLDNVKFTDPHVKVNLILQSHFSRSKLNAEMELDKEYILMECHKLLQGLVDVISSNKMLSPALAAMELSQMLVQAMWDRDSPLLQLPWINHELVQVLAGKNVKTVFDLTEMENDERNEALKFDNDELMDLANALNRYPNVEMSHQLDEVQCGTLASLFVSLDVEEEITTPIYAPFYPKKKFEEWWIVLGDVRNNQLVAIKRIGIKKKTQVKLDFIAPEQEGEYNYKLFLMCDSYLGCDQEYNVQVVCRQGEHDHDNMNEE